MKKTALPAIIARADFIVRGDGGGTSDHAGKFSGTMDSLANYNCRRRPETGECASKFTKLMIGADNLRLDLISI
jgi:hypothetical protein